MPLRYRGSRCAILASTAVAVLDMAHSRHSGTARHLPSDRLAQGYVMQMNRRAMFTGAAAAGAAGLGLAAATPASAVGASSGELDFAIDFHSSFAEVAAWMDGVASNAPRPEVKWAPGSYQMNAQLGLRSGHRLRGTDLPSREFGSGVVWRAPGGAPSFFAKRTNSQGYPSDGSVRDLTVAGVAVLWQHPGPAPEHRRRRLLCRKHAVVLRVPRLWVRRCAAHVRMGRRVPRHGHHSRPGDQ